MGPDKEVAALVGVVQEEMVTVAENVAGANTTRTLTLTPNVPERTLHFHPLMVDNLRPMVTPPGKKTPPSTTP